MPTADADDRLISVDDIAALCGVSVTTAWEWARTPSFPRALKPSSKATRWWRGEILAWLESTREKAR